MDNSSFFFITQAQDSTLAMGYLDDGVTQRSVPMFLRPAGQFTTTAGDMQRLLEFLLGDGSLNGQVFIAPEHMDSLATPSTTDASLAGLSLGHGLALALRDRHGVVGGCHPGQTFGFRAQLCLFPEEGKAFFYAINADDESADYERFTEYFIRRIDIQPYPEVPVATNVGLAKYSGLYELAPANMAEFAWLDWMFNSVWLSEDPERNGLVMRSLQGQPRLLLPLGEGLFRDSQRSMASHVFVGDDSRVLSYGLVSWQRASLLSLCLAWLSLVLGALGLLYIVVRGFWLLFRGPSVARSTILWPWLCLMAFSFPIYLYSRQSYLQFGELTMASAALAALSALLPLCLMYSLYRWWTHRERRLFDMGALLVSFQLCLVLLYQGVLPLVFWQ
jgi:hypothetical protein